MEQATPQARGNIRLYACGGAGINIGSTFEKFRGNPEPGLASIDTVYLDTSRSNLKPNLPDDHIYILEGANSDGSGKERRQNAAPIMKAVKEMLQKHRPGYVNVIVSSASGGTGAVIAACLTNELLAKDELVINITIGVTDSGAEIENTLDTLRSFEGLVEATKKSVVVAYFENTKETPPSEVDASILELMSAISVIFSRQNEGLDTRDKYNFLNVDRKTSYKPHAVGLETFAGDLKEDEHAGTITVVSAVTNKDNRGIDFRIPYTCYGVLPADIDSEITTQSPIHLVTKAYPFNGIAGKLRGYLDEMQREAEARTVQSEVLAGNNKELSGGFLAL